MISTSILEGHPVGIMEAMAKGIKPLIHNFVGARHTQFERCIWNCIEDCVRLVTEKEYNSKEYRDFIENKYSKSQMYELIKKEIGKMIHDEKAGVNIEKKKKPLVTIGIVNYNNARYLPICIQSFLKQTYSNLEIIIVDDNSVDGSKKLIEAYQKKHANIKSIIHKKNTGGPTTGCQEIVLYAKGEYIQFISSDDFVSTNAIEQWVDYLECNLEIDYCFSDVNIVNENNEFVNQLKYVCYSPQEVVYKFFETERGVIPTHGLFRKKFFTMNQINWMIYRENDYSTDTLNFIYFIKNNIKYDKLEEPLVQYRLHDKNLSCDLEKRISGAAAILDFIVNNFNASVYLPGIPWELYGDGEQFKFYIHAKIYYEKIEKTIDLSSIPDIAKRGRTVDRKKIIFFAREFIQDCEKYIDMGLKLNGPYELELTNLQDKIVKIKSEMQ